MVISGRRVVAGRAYAWRPQSRNATAYAGKNQWVVKMKTRKKIRIPQESSISGHPDAASYFKGLEQVAEK